MIGPEFINFVITREEIEAGEFARMRSSLSSLLINKPSVMISRSRIDLGIQGYSQDPRELYEIAEVRNFLCRLHALFPFWFYFLNLKTPSLYILTLCLCRIERERSGQIRVDRNDFISFYDYSLGAAKDICQTYYLTEAIYAEIELGIHDYYASYHLLR